MFKEIAGHHVLKQKLIETARSGRVSHAQLFFGPEGNGGLPLAIAYCQYLACQNPGENDSCGTCVNCKQFRSFNYPDLNFVYPVAKTQKSSSKPISEEFREEWLEIVQDKEYFGVFDWLEALGIENKQAQISVYESATILKKLQLKSYAGDYKFTIIWLPERMNGSSANKLLKIIEEPPEKTLFLLVSEDPEALLQTITSRCQKVLVPKYPIAEAQNYLEQSESLEPSAASIIAKLVDGNLAQAKKLAQKSDAFHQYAELFAQWVRACFKADVKQLIDWSESLGKFERERLKDFLKFCSNTFRDSLNLNFSTEPSANSIFKEVQFELEKFAPFVHLKNTSIILEDIDRATYDIGRNGNPKVILADLSLNMARHLRLKP